MKAISLWQPWATLVAVGAKRNETRSRRWDYVGDVAVHAARRKVGRDVPDYMVTALRLLWQALKAGYGLPPARDVEELYYALPFGAVVCVAEKAGCEPTELVKLEHCENGAAELELGDYSLIVTGMLGKLVLRGCSWGYGGEGPHATRDVLLKLGLPQHEADDLAFLTPNSDVGSTGSKGKVYFRRALLPQVPPGTAYEVRDGRVVTTGTFTVGGAL